MAYPCALRIAVSGLPLAVLTAFVAKWDPLALIEVMRAVIQAADPSTPATVTQRAYNEARCHIGFGHTPRAEKLTGRYGVEWAPLVRMVSTEELPARTIARASHVREREVLTTAEAVFAFQAVGRRLGTDEITPALYEQGRQTINREVGRRYRHGSAAMPLPSLDVVREKFAFTEIAAAAGLRCAERAVQRLMPRAHAVLLFVEHCGFQPGQEELRRFARHHRVQLVAREHERHSQAIATARAESARTGRWFPTRRPLALPTGWQQYAQADSPALSRARAEFPAAKKAGYTVEEVRAAVRRAFDLLPPGEALTQERYRALSTAHGLPSPSVIQRLTQRTGTGFGTLVREVALERAAAMRAQAPIVG